MPGLREVELRKYLFFSGGAFSLGMGAMAVLAAVAPQSVAIVCARNIVGDALCLVFAVICRTHCG